MYNGYITYVMYMSIIKLRCVYTSRYVNVEEEERGGGGGVTIIIIIIMIVLCTERPRRRLNIK